MSEPRSASSNGMSLLEELRFTADAYARNYSDHKHTPALLRTAAATLERLETKLKRHEPVSLYNGRDIDSWKSEAERLRKQVTHMRAAFATSSTDEERRLRAALERARKQLRRYSDIDPMTEEIDRLLSGDSSAPVISGHKDGCNYPNTGRTEDCNCGYAKSAHETKAPQAPVFRVRMLEVGAEVTRLYAPGVPSGEYDVYLDPSAPGLTQETSERCTACGHLDRYHFDDGHGNVVCRFLKDCACVHRIEPLSPVKPVPRCTGPHDLQPTDAYGDNIRHCTVCGIAEYQLPENGKGDSNG